MKTFNASASDEIEFVRMDGHGNTLRCYSAPVTKDYECYRKREFFIHEVTPEGCEVFRIEIGPRPEVAARLNRWVELIQEGKLK